MKKAKQDHPHIYVSYDILRDVILSDVLRLHISGPNGNKLRPALEEEIISATGNFQRKIYTLRKQSVVDALAGNIAGLKADIAAALKSPSNYSGRVVNDICELVRVLPKYADHIRPHNLSRISEINTMRATLADTVLFDDFLHTAIQFDYVKDYKNTPEDNRGSYDYQSKTAEVFTTRDDTRERKSTHGHELGHGLQFEYALGISTYNDSIKQGTNRRRFESNRREAFKSIDKIRKASKSMIEAYAVAFEMLYMEEMKRRDIKIKSSLYLCFENYLPILKSNPAEGLLKLNDNAVLHDIWKCRATPEPLASILAYRFGKLLQRHFDENGYARTVSGQPSRSVLHGHRRLARPHA